VILKRDKARLAEHDLRVIAVSLSISFKKSSSSPQHYFWVLTIDHPFT
jgi:hypothetical protein